MELGRKPRNIALPLVSNYKLFDSHYIYYHQWQCNSHKNSDAVTEEYEFPTINNESTYNVFLFPEVHFDPKNLFDSLTYKVDNWIDR